MTVDSLSNNLHRSKIFSSPMSKKVIIFLVCTVIFPVMRKDANLLSKLTIPFFSEMISFFL